MVFHTVLWTYETIVLHTTETTNTTMAQLFETNKNFIEGTGVNFTTINNLNNVNNGNQERFVKLVTATEKQVKQKITTYY